jgi:hypothetical protein
MAATGVALGCVVAVGIFVLEGMLVGLAVGVQAGVGCRGFFGVQDARMAAEAVKPACFKKSRLEIFFSSLIAYSST